ncbi:unnamed protein product [Arabidopsis thaliana]|uniref:C2H2-type domain-containing protein n=1 Tax=Arabidopsis thaliana TaxID=3702 RepID=A0A5S9WS21_ARATH|nr:unnamed protein product [Arabidopsis thaliana]
MEPEMVRLPIHEHWLTPARDNRWGKCCGLQFKTISDGYNCRKCRYFIHKSCSNCPKEINHPSHKCDKNLSLITNFASWSVRCRTCKETIQPYIQNYECQRCEFNIHLDCFKYPPPEVIDFPQNHDHKLKLEMVRSSFTCFTCGKGGSGYPYKCHECDLAFHVDCEKYGAEVNHPSHSLHTLKLITGKPLAYTDGNCSLCGKKIFDEMFYHCSACNFTLDLRCVSLPPPLNLHDLNTHNHELTLMAKLISFTCTTCGLHGDRSPYVCLQCNFTSHNNCSGFPWVININRHDHRVSRTSLLGIIDSVCGVCRKKMDWSCGGYSCKRCSESTFHTKCATREDVWDGIEMKDEPEEDEPMEPFEVIDEDIIRHFSHIEHNLKLDKSGTFVEERSCKACAYPIYHDPFYSCMSCDFLLHENCAKHPTRKRHVLSNKPYILHASQRNYSKCKACGVFFNCFIYGTFPFGLDVRCASFSGSLVHPSHQHPLFYTSPKGVCSACNKETSHVLRCVEDKCGYALDFKCALLPHEVKHRVDDHFLSLCFGERDASGKYWCDICEEETDPTKWFYTCKDCGVTLHTNCVLGDFRGLEPETNIVLDDDWMQMTLYETVRNNSMSRPLCYKCKYHCIFPIILKVTDEDKYFCSISCCDIKTLPFYN